MHDSIAARASFWILRVLEVVVTVTIFVMMVHTVANAILRSTMNSPLTGTHEYVSYWYLPIVALLGFVCAQRGRAHVEARLIFDRFPRRNQVEIQVAGQLITIVLCLGFAYYGWYEAVDAWQVGLVGGVIGLAIWPVTFLVPVAFGILAVQVATEMAIVIKRRDPSGSASITDRDDDVVAEQKE